MIEDAMNNPANNTKLVIKIEYDKPIELVDLTISLNSLANLYQNLHNNDKGAKLYIKEIRKSSIEIDLITPVFLSTIPVISSANTIIQFALYLKSMWLACSGTDTERAKKLIHENGLPVHNEKNLNEFRNFLGVAQNNSDNCTVSAVNNFNGDINAHFHFSGQEAVIAKENIEKMLPSKESYIKKMQLFRWVQTNFKNPNSGNRGIIENIYKKPLRVIFENNSDKEQMTTSSDSVDWQDKHYVVDVEAQYSGGRPMVYKILKNYPNESFSIEPEEDVLMA